MHSSRLFILGVASRERTARSAGQTFAGCQIFTLELLHPGLNVACEFAFHPPRPEKRVRGTQQGKCCPFFLGDCWVPFISPILRVSKKRRCCPSFPGRFFFVS